MDKAYVRQLVESALAAREEMIAARLAAESAREASKVAEDRARERVKKLGEVIGNRRVLYRGLIVSAELGLFPDCLSVAPLESVEVLDAPEVAYSQAKKVTNKPSKPPKAAFDDGAPPG